MRDRVQCQLLAGRFERDRHRSRRDRTHRLQQQLPHPSPGNDEYEVRRDADAAVASSMPLAELALENIRCIQRAELALAPGINLIHGPNASGKTSILEGIYLLGRGRSFRTRNTERLIR